MLAKKFQYKQISMPEDMRESVLDEVRKVIEGTSDSVSQTKQLKENLEKLFGGEWQVIIGEGEIATYFSKKYIDCFIELKADQKTMLIFKRIATEHPVVKK